MRKTLSTRLAVLLGAGALLAACGDNIKPGGGDDDDDDTVPIDGPMPDMEPPPVTSGTVTILETAVLGVDGSGNPIEAAQGMVVQASFFESAKAPVYEEMPGSIFGCKVFEFTPAEAADVGLDEGTLEVTIDNDPATDGVQGPVIPTCRYVADKGYLCPDPHANTNEVAGGAIAVADCTNGIISLTDMDAGAFPFTTQDGRYVAFANTGSALYDNNAFPIVSKPADTMILFYHPVIDANAALCAAAPIAVLPDAATHQTLGGAGPIPQVPDPGFLADDGTLTAEFTAGGDNDIPSFTADFPAATGGVGNDYDLVTTATLPTFASLPLDGSAFTIACDETADTGACRPGTGDGVVLNIVTTDADVTGLPATSMPLPTTKRVQVRCAALLTATVTVPAAASAYLMDSGATRVQTTFIHGDLATAGDASQGYEVRTVAGHALTTFKTPAPPAKQ